MVVANELKLDCVKFHLSIYSSNRLQRKLANNQNLQRLLVY